MKRIGVDVGGTFTDLILVDEETGRIAVDEVASTPDDPARAVVEGVEQLCARPECRWPRSTTSRTGRPSRRTSSSRTAATDA
jgi:N-methylhydantoinase A/oxoprolinase/acetone carboxylase beta subunit